eukprot:c7804_g1_i1.p1 GENE.c7804_g1_i1~~c7804_g1_i1.p1  ORF type:complete len:239 (+),score=15.49 c7804_g1_i1:34-717(+)
MSRVAGQVQFAARESVQIVQNAVDDNIADLEDLYELAVLHNKSVDSAFARTDGWQHPPPMVTAPIDKSEYANVTPRNDSGQYQKLDRQFPQSWYTSRKSQVVYVNDGEAPEIPVPKANHGFLSSILGGCGGRPLKPEVQVAQRVIQKPATIVDDPTSTFNIANAPGLPCHFPKSKTCKQPVSQTTSWPSCSKSNQFRTSASVLVLTSRLQRRGSSSKPSPPTLSASA